MRGSRPWRPRTGSRCRCLRGEASIFDRLALDGHLQGLDRTTFSRKLSQLESDLFALHPFRDGNTRSTTTFVGLLARQAGWEIRWHDADPAAMQAELRASYRSP